MIHALFVIQQFRLALLCVNLTLQSKIIHIHFIRLKWSLSHKSQCTNTHTREWSIKRRRKQSFSPQLPLSMFFDSKLNYFLLLFSCKIIMISTHEIEELLFFGLIVSLKLKLNYDEKFVINSKLSYMFIIGKHKNINLV